jgi:hypothetical protein
MFKGIILKNVMLSFAFRPADGLDTAPGFSLCAEHVRQLEGESPFDNLMEVKS